MVPPIAIVGAGPSGLTLGRLLQINDIDYAIFERDQSEEWAAARGGGGTLDLHIGSGQLALEKAGLLDQFKSLARYDVPITFAAGDGKIYARFGEEGDSEKPEIDRKDLRTLLLNSIPKDKIRWGSKIQSVQRAGEQSMSIHFMDGSVKSGYRLVVGADGAWSKVRSLVNDAKPQYSGFHFISSTIRPSNPLHSSAGSLCGTGNYLAFGNEMQSILMLLGDGSYFLAVGLRLPEDWSSRNADLVTDPAALGNWLASTHLSTWSDTHKDLFRHADDKFRPWPLYALPSESISWKTVPGVALVGDAAHLTTPFVGEGVNCAMFDSLQLAEQIIEHGLSGLYEAVSQYEKSMLPRGSDLIQRSEEKGKLFFAPDAPRGMFLAFGLKWEDS